MLPVGTFWLAEFVILIGIVAWYSFMPARTALMAPAPRWVV